MKKKNCKNQFVGWPVKNISKQRIAWSPRLKVCNEGFMLVSMCMLIPVVMGAVALAYASFLKLVLIDITTSSCLNESLDQLEKQPPDVKEQKIILSRVIEGVHLTLNGYELFKERKLECGAEFINQNGRRHYYLIPGKS